MIILLMMFQGKYDFCKVLKVYEVYSYSYVRCGLILNMTNR